MNTDLTKLLTSQVKALTASAIVDVEIDISPNNDNSIILVCDEKYKNQVKVSFSGGTLKVGAEGIFNNAGSMKVILKASSLEEITSSGTSDISGVYNGSNLKIKVSGTGDVNLSGTVRDLDVNISGTGDASLKGLEAKNVTLKLSGTSDAKVFASDSCSVTISGIGDATVYGNPEKMQQKVSGLGSVKQANGNKKSTEKVNKMPFFNANIFETSFNSKMFKNEKITNEKYLQEDYQKMEIEIKNRIQDLKNSKLDNQAVTKELIEKPFEEPVQSPLSVTARLKAKFKGLL